RGYLGGAIAFGPEGDAWMPYLEHGLVRMTPDGRQKGYRQVEGAVVAGHEGNIWSLEWTKAWRIFPGGA
ncbi:MAG TPA: hypothetical protein VHA80_06965, partial [Solirubrobacterales bacterium]|nr:hypothetical protein [Solirubrobacterales bacterium]